MNFDFEKYSISSIDAIRGFSIATKELLFELDEIQDATLEGDAETVWSTGRQGRRLSSMKRNKTCSISANNGFVVGGLMAQQFGDQDPTIDFENPTTSIPHGERLIAGTGGTTTETTYAATGIVGNEIAWIYRTNRDGSPGQSFPQAATASATAFAYNPATREITLPTGVFNAGDMITVFYEHMTRGKRYVNRSDSYAGDCYLICDITVKDVCDGTLQYSKLVMPKVSMSDNFSFAFGNDMVVQSFSAEASASICAGESEYFYWVIKGNSSV